MFLGHDDLLLNSDDFKDCSVVFKPETWEREGILTEQWSDRVMVRQTERGRQIPWLCGCCGILGLVERSSSPSHVCFGHLCKTEICSSSLPACALLQQQTIGVKHYSGTITHHEPAATRPCCSQQLVSKPIIIRLLPQSTAKWIFMIRWQWLLFIYLFFTRDNHLSAHYLP